MFRRRAEPVEPEVPEWERRLRDARRTIEEQRPPAFVLVQLDELTHAITTAQGERERIEEVARRVDVEAASRELKRALRSIDPSPEHERLVASLRARHESAHAVANRVDDLGTAIERALVDLDLLAARSVVLGSSTESWTVDEAIGRLADDLTALERAHAEIDGRPTI